MQEPAEQLDVLAYHTIGAAIEVHRTLGPGFLESVYERALCVELALRHIQFANQVPIGVQYKGESVGESRIDFCVESQLLVELKTTEVIAPIHLAQMLSYLKATGHRLGLIINFNVPVLRQGVQRVIHTP